MDLDKIKARMPRVFCQASFEIQGFFGDKPILSIKLRILSTYDAKILRNLGVDRIWTGLKNF